jgi:drug/metabolite transporter (DMT)-like permease
METKSPDWLTLLTFGLTVLLGGNNAVAVRFSNEELPPFFGAAVRFGLASLILFVLVLILRLPIPRGRSLWGALIFGVLAGGLSYALLYWSLLHIQAGLTMVILALVPLLTFILAFAQRQEAFRWEALIGSLLAVGGIGIIFWNQLSANIPLLPMLAVVIAAACFAEATVLIKSFPQAHPITTNALALSTGAVLLFIFSVIARESPVLPTLTTTWAALIYLIILGSVVTFGLSLFVIRRWTASSSSYQFVLFPIVTIVVGAWLADESVSAAFLFGGLLVLAGVTIGGIMKPNQLKNIYRSLASRVTVRTARR